MKILKKKRIVVFTLIFLTANLSAQNPVLGVMNIAAKEGIRKADVEAATEILFSFVHQHGHRSYNVIDKQARNSLLGEQQFGLSDACDSVECAVQIGLLLSAQYMIFGSLSTAGGYFHVNLRLVDVNTSSVTAAAYVKARSMGEIDVALETATMKLFGMKQAQRNEKYHNLL